MKKLARSLLVVLTATFSAACSPIHSASYPILAFGEKPQAARLYEREAVHLARAEVKRHGIEVEHFKTYVRFEFEFTRREKIWWVVFIDPKRDNRIAVLIDDQTGSARFYEKH